jgi:hypothetical protein
MKRFLLSCQLALVPRDAHRCIERGLFYDVLLSNQGNVSLRRRRVGAVRPNRPSAEFAKVCSVGRSGRWASARRSGRRYLVESNWSSASIDERAICNLKVCNAAWHPAQLPVLEKTFRSRKRSVGKDRPRSSCWTAKRKPQGAERFQPTPSERLLVWMYSYGMRRIANCCPASREVSPSRALANRRQTKLESRTVPGITGCRQLSSVGFDDRAADRQSHAHSVGLRREESA